MKKVASMFILTHIDNTSELIYRTEDGILWCNEWSFVKEDYELVICDSYKLKQIAGTNPNFLIQENS